MNNGYSRIRSKSIDFADPSQTAKQLPESQVPHVPKSTSKTHSSTQEHEQEEDGDWEIFGVILERSRSVSSALPSHRSHKPEKQRALVLQSPTKRTFSMRRSSSISGGYCRIHHQSGSIADDENTVNLNVLQRRSVKRRGKILKACMRLLGL